MFMDNEFIFSLPESSTVIQTNKLYREGEQRTFTLSNVHLHSVVYDKRIRERA